MTRSEAYQLLGLLPGAGADEIKAAFRRATLEAHPDKHPGDPLAGERFRRVLEAYEALQAPQVRQLAPWLAEGLARAADPSVRAGLETVLGRDTGGAIHEMLGVFAGIARKRGAR